MRDNSLVTFGSIVRLTHVKSSRSLTSDDINYNTGSHQQKVTCSSQHQNDLWLVKADHGTGMIPSDSFVPYGCAIRLEHLSTHKNLHSHPDIKSPVTGQQEITCFGSTGVGDTGDDWVVEHAAGQMYNGHPWRKGDEIRLIHRNTNHALHSHDRELDCGSQYEVTGFDSRDANDLWVVPLNETEQINVNYATNTNYDIPANIDTKFNPSAPQLYPELPRQGYEVPAMQSVQFQPHMQYQQPYMQFPQQTHETGFQVPIEQMPAHSKTAEFRAQTDFFDQGCDSDIGDQVKYGDTIRLQHVETGRRLHSHDITYYHGGGSGQQQVTCFADRDDNDFWKLKASHSHGDHHANNVGQPIRYGDIIRLEHAATGRNLHSHYGHSSPASGQQEVTAFGSCGHGDDNDNWRIEHAHLGCTGQAWRKGDHIRLVHVETNRALYSQHSDFDVNYSDRQQEVSCSDCNDSYALWVYEY